MEVDNRTKLSSFSDRLVNEYGEYGSPEREAFQAKALAWYCGEVLRDRRKELKLTQKELGERIGKERSYIAKIEKGETDMQLSSFIRIVRALGLTIDLKPEY